MINIAIIGFGIVGTGTAEVLRRMKESSTHRKQEDVSLKYILVRRDFPDSPYKDIMVKDFDLIVNDPDLHIVVESMGGVGAAYEMTKKALSKGKSVVSSNKELVATHGYELLELAKQNNCNYLFEAAVGGGIPVLHPVAQCLKSNEITEIRGILNGTCNYILTTMEEDETLSFESVLKTAQELGFAEQDPSADVDGHDTCRKISILANMAFGNQVNASLVPVEGIRNISAKDMQYTSHDYTIKLVGRTFLDQKHNPIVYVAPHFINNSSDQKGNPLYNVKGVLNAVVVKGDSVGTAVFGGPGAGSLPTASAVMADVYELAPDHHRPRGNGWGNAPVTLGDVDSLEDCYFVRFNQDKDSVTAHCTQKGLDFQVLSPNLTGNALTEWHSHTVALQIKTDNKQALVAGCDGLNVGNILRFLNA